MQKILEDVLNASIALFRSGESNLNSSINKIKATFDELKKKGASDKSDAAVKLRASLTEITAKVDQLSGKAGSSYKEVLKQLETQITALTEQMTKIVPKETIAQVKSKIDELQKAIKEKLGK